MQPIIAFNKPYRVLPQFTDASPKQRDTLAQYIKAPGYYPAGRLDYDSEGLMLLTNDGKLQAKISHPKHKLNKTYWVQVDGDISKTALRALTAGIVLKDGPASAVSAHRIHPPNIWQREPPVRYRAAIPTSWIELTLQEGRNRQVRRMTAHVGFPTLRLIRAQIGSIHLENLQPGEWRTHAREALFTK